MLLRYKFLQQTNEKVKHVQKKMKASSTRQKSYTDKRRQSLKFEVVDHIFLQLLALYWKGWLLSSLDHIRLLEELVQ